MMKTNTFFLIVIPLFTLAFLRETPAINPPPDGGYAAFNTAEGQNALFSLTTGVANTAVGWSSLNNDTEGGLNTAMGAGTLLLNIGNENTGEGSGNTAVGTAALLSNVTGARNTANGAFALFSNQAGVENTAAGYQALFFNDSTGNTQGFANSGFGAYALLSNTDGFYNSAVGWSALSLNTGGNYNNAFGASALSSNDGSFNNAFGSRALKSNTFGAFNNAVGESALFFNATGNYNCAFGAYALNQNTDSSYNNAFGLNALLSAIGFGNNGFGSEALMFVGLGIENTAIGDFAGYNVDGDYNICIGAGVAGNSGENNTIHMGDNLPDDPGASACFIGGINGQTTATGTAVLIDATGKLGTLTSSSRFKKEIKPIDDASEMLFSLKPVAFRYKKEIDPAGRSQFGLVAEDVEKVNPDLVVRDKKGKPYSVRYDQVNAMLLNEFLKAHRRMEEQEATIAKQQKQIDALTRDLRKVSAKFELSKSAPQTVLNR
jgi:hypothetical protein